MTKKYSLGIYYYLKYYKLIAVLYAYKLTGVIGAYNLEN